MKKVPVIVALIAVGLAGNYFGYPAFINADYLFGSFFSMLVLQVFGFIPGIIAAFIISAGTFFTAYHPYSLLVLVGEVVVVGWLYSRNKGFAFVFMDTLYWLIIGMPVGYLCSRFSLDLDSSLSFIFMFKQAINGICNALMARLLFMFLQVRGRDYMFPLREVIFNFLALFMLIPSFVIFTYESRRDFNQFDRGIRQALLGESRQTVNSLNLWLHEKIIKVNSLAWRKTHYKEVSQDNLDAIRESDFDLSMIGFIDKNAMSTAFSPVVDDLGASTIGLDFSDRQYLVELKRTLQPQLSEVVLSKFGEPDPIVVLAAPVLADGIYDGYVAGIFNIIQIRQILTLAASDDGLDLTLIDKNGLVIVSTHQTLSIMAPFARSAGEQQALADGLVQWTPDLPRLNSLYERWWNTVYFIESEVGNHGEWTLIVEQSVAPYRMELTGMYANQLEIVFVILILTMIFARLISRNILGSFGQLHDISIQLQHDVTSVDQVVWPKSMVSEVDYLIGTVKDIATLLVSKIREVISVNENLETRIAKRTRQLAELNSNLETQVKEEVERRHKQEQLLVQQAKLAAMGEMLGAIAHQWRQPLNTLGLCVQNIKDAYRFGELDQGYLDATVDQSMAQIAQMSKTIDDFRDFFRKDKNITRFDAMAVVGEVLSLFSPQLRVHDIRFVLSCLTHQRSFDRVEDIVLCPEKEMEGSKNEFKHVILNLISNAKDAICERRGVEGKLFSESGYIIFDFSTVEKEIVITVRDNGVGISAQLRDRVFEPYFTTKKPGCGTGIGMYLAKIIIEEHFHGKLTVGESEQGAAFVITVPAGGIETQGKL